MSAGLAVQYAVVALIVAASGLLAIRKLAPQLTLACGRIDPPAPARSLAVFQMDRPRQLQPKQATGDCADGCAT